MTSSNTFVQAYDALPSHLRSLQAHVGIGQRIGSIEGMPGSAVQRVDVCNAVRHTLTGSSVCICVDLVDADNGFSHGSAFHIARTAVAVTVSFAANGLVRVFDNAFLDGLDQLDTAYWQFTSNDDCYCFSSCLRDVCLGYKTILWEEIGVQNSHTAKGWVVFTVFDAKDRVVWNTGGGGNRSQVASARLKCCNDFFKHVYLCHDDILR